MLARIDLNYSQKCNKIIVSTKEDEGRESKWAFMFLLGIVIYFIHH